MLGSSFKLGASPLGQFTFTSLWNGTDSVLYALVDSYVVRLLLLVQILGSSMLNL